MASARITRIEITQIESPAFGGASFGEVGAYEKLIGRAFGEVDPRDPANRDITDLALAPKNARGMVEYDTGIMILRPIDPARGNRRLLYELTNTLSDLNLDITSAHIATFGEQAVDVFYVTDLTNKKVTGPQRQKAIEERLLAVLDAAQD